MVTIEDLPLVTRLGGTKKGVDSTKVTSLGPYIFVWKDGNTYILFE